ncbi:uncharacterized protein A4U43_C09F4670 [Asparagus officinalis]|uniref:CRM domain-containing protein n=2 Tax=Asparagus officinalis TaxID=4686 RepID=A0A5P1E5B9_ASPOF|nr:uncharacterized CRM domain-containing protein At3g25440, chloroplastic isoform X2 [Asparagus officinalis]ONK57834.1 uncharacterized protein A4U43_C09F4670 [Asparagus officinalis]
MAIPSLFLQRLRPRRTSHHQLLSNFPRLRNQEDPCNKSWALRSVNSGYGNLTKFERESSLAPFCKVLDQISVNRFLSGLECTRFTRICTIHTSRHLTNTSEVVEAQNSSTGDVTVDANGSTKVKRKKLKGRRAVVKFLKSLRWKKKKEYERMTAEEKILYKLRKARKKEERLVEALKKIEPSESSETKHDPEILTPEEHFYLLKMGHKCKNYVPVGRRGIFQGVILNMHLHWKKHQTLKVIVKTFTPEEVREIAAELARLSGGIVLEIHEDNEIIMYRGKNYSQPPTEIMSPKVTLSRKKALDKSKHRDALRAVRRFIPKLQQDLESLQIQMKTISENKVKDSTEKELLGTGINDKGSDHLLDNSDEFQDEEVEKELDGDESLEESDILSESEALSDLFETDTDEGKIEEKEETPLYLNTLEKFSSGGDDKEQVDFETHLRQISAAAKRGDSPENNNVKVSDLDEIDQIFLRADFLLNKKRR